jgi:hypothetical protein
LQRQFGGQSISPKADNKSTGRILGLLHPNREHPEEDQVRRVIRLNMTADVMTQGHLIILHLTPTIQVVVAVGMMEVLPAVTIPAGEVSVADAKKLAFS